MSNQENRIAIGEGDFVEVIYPPSLNQKEIDRLVELVREALHIGFIVVPAVVQLKVHRKNDLESVVGQLEKQTELLERISEQLSNL